MKKIEIKKVTASSAFKVNLYFAIIPSGLMILGGLIALAIGMATGTSEVIVGGVVYLIFSIAVFLLSGAFGALFALIYNVTSNRFGGLEIVVNEEDVDHYDI